MLSPMELKQFVKDSNAIEGIYGEPQLLEIDLLAGFLSLAEITVLDLENFVSLIQPGAKLRLHPNQTVMVGNHVPPAPGQAILYKLNNLLNALHSDPRSVTPYQLHCAYLTLHPFTDGNGRSARALYAWHSNKLGYQGYVTRGFLKQFYYDALGESDGRLGT